MKIAIPVANGKLCAHFGHCEVFSIFEVEDKKVISQDDIVPPPHEPGLLPRWLGEKEVNIIIAGGMGQRAQMLFAEQSIDVKVGAPALEPKNLVELFLANDLQTGQNLCDH